MRPEKIFIAALALAGFAAAAGAAPTMIVLSSATYDSGAEDKAYALATDADGNVFLTGTSGDNYLSQKYSKTLVLSPTAQQPYANGNTSNNAKGIALDGLGNIIVVGEENNTSDLDYLVLKYSPNFAALLSSAVYDNGEYNSAAAVKTDSQNNIFVTGYSAFAGNKDFYTIKYSAELNKLSTAAYDGGGIDEATAIAVDHSDNVIVAGYIQNGTSYYYMVVKYDNNLSTIAFNSFGSGNGNDRATGVVVDSNDNIIVTGRQNDGVTQNYCTRKYDSFLNFLSSAVYNSGGADIPTGVAVDSSDNIIVTGHSNNNYFTIKYDRYLNEISSSSYDGGFTDLSNAIATDADDNVIVTGQSYSGTNFNYFTVKYNASPRLTEVSPLYIGESANVTLKGRGLLADSAVVFQDPGISTGAVSLVSGQITMPVTPAATVTLGVTTVTVTNTNGESFTSCSLAYTRLRRTVLAGQPETINAMTKRGQVTVAIPSGAFPYQETVTIYTVPVAAGDLRQVGEALYFSVANSSPPVSDISIKLRYSVADLGTYPEGSLSLAYYDAAAGWVGVPSSVDTFERSVTGSTRAINVKFAVVKEAQGSGPGGGSGGSGIPARVYPNPYRPGSGGNFDQSALGDGIVFAGFGAGQAFKLTIVDMAGRLVYQKSAVADSTGKYLWDTRTVSGGKAASGVYIYLLEGSGGPKKGKLSIIR